MRGLAHEHGGSMAAVAVSALPLERRSVARVFTRGSVFLSVLGPLFFVRGVTGGNGRFLRGLLPPVGRRSILTLLSRDAGALLRGRDLLRPTCCVGGGHSTLGRVRGSHGCFSKRVSLLGARRDRDRGGISRMVGGNRRVITGGRTLRGGRFRNISIRTLGTERTRVSTTLSSSGQNGLLTGRTRTRGHRCISGLASRVTGVRTRVATVGGGYRRLITRTRGVGINSEYPAYFAIIARRGENRVMTRLGGRCVT